jgi:FkbM family methyltransferase
MSLEYCTGDCIQKQTTFDGDVCNAYVTQEILRRGSNPKFCVDIGAFEGWWSHWVSCRLPSAKVWVFEPEPKNFLKIAHRFAGHMQIQTQNMAIGSQEGSLTFYSAGSDTTCRKQSVGDISGTEPFVVKAMPLDALLKEPVDLLKIDSEGHELEIFQGMIQSLGRGWIRNLIFELSLHWYEDGGFESLVKAGAWIMAFLHGFPYVYSFSRNGSPYVCQITQENLQAFLIEHRVRHLQTDICCTHEPIQTLPVFLWEPEKYYA